MSTQFIMGLENFSRDNGHPVIATIGTFDGIHLGHQEIIRRLRDQSRETGYTPLMVTFHPHPRVLVSPEHIPLLLTTIEEKERFVPHFLDGKVLVLDFNDALKQLSAEAFVKQILVDAIGARKVIVGYDHAFGRNRSGNTAELVRLGGLYGFDVEVVGPVLYKDRPISSSRIRATILNNEYPEALKMLGHDYAIYGVVERGIGLGRRLGYPTANVRYSTRKLLPFEGVYACWVQVGSEEKNGMMFIGKNHFNPQDRVTVEANLFDFDRDIYDEEIVVYPTRYIRQNQIFHSTEKLIQQLHLDKQHVLQITQKEKENVNEQRAQG